MVQAILCRRRGGVWRDENGTATIEAVLWLPIFAYLICLAADVSTAFYTHSQVLRVLQDVNRAYSVGRIGSTEGAEAAIAARLPDLAAGLEVHTTVTDGIIDSVASVPMSSVVAIGALPEWVAGTLTVRSYHYAEL